MIATATTKLNLGSGKYPLEGWTNIDLHCRADIEADFRELNFWGVDVVRMSHLLEHISWRETQDVLELVYGWLTDGGVLEVEVPDMEAIMALGTKHPLWFKYVYGDQSHEGEYHLAGFTIRMLEDCLWAAGFHPILLRKIVSEHKGREGMPCLYAEATK